MQHKKIADRNVVKQKHLRWHFFFLCHDRKSTKDILHQLILKYFIVAIKNWRGDDRMIFDILELIVYAIEFLFDLMDYSTKTEKQ